ncbi:hypothetical protein [Loktanella salsilacus]|uniref:hypothetical protein n=1 Tax=Loktanella salsilacus TaxID=195913 RepID=UPI00356943CB
MEFDDLQAVPDHAVEHAGGDVDGFDAEAPALLAGLDELGIGVGDGPVGQGLRVAEQLDIKEIATAEGVSTRTVKRHLNGQQVTQ